MPKPTKTLGQKVGQGPKGRTTKIRVYDATNKAAAAKNAALMDAKDAQLRKDVQSTRKGGR